jgi:hypothetical protein
VHSNKPTTKKKQFFPSRKLSLKNALVAYLNTNAFGLNEIVSHLFLF